MLHHPGDGVETDFPGHLRILTFRHEGVVAAAQIGVAALHAVERLVAQAVDAFLAALPKRDVGVAAVGRHPHEGLGHEAGDEVVLARDLGADLAVGREAIAGAQAVVEGEVELELPRGVLVVPLDHVEPHEARVLDDLQEHRAQRLELIDVVAVGLGEAAGGLAVLAAFQPHHLGLHAVAQVQPVVLFLELVVDAAKIAAAVRGQIRARIFNLLAVPEAGAVHAGHALVPRKLAEGFRIGDANELGRLRAVTDVVAVAINKQISGGAIDQLESPLGGALPVIRGNTLADDASGNGNELVVDVVDTERVDLLAHFLDQRRAPRPVHVGFEIGIGFPGGAFFRGFLFPPRLFCSCIHDSPPLAFSLHSGIRSGSSRSGLTGQARRSRRADVSSYEIGRIVFVFVG